MHTQTSKGLKALSSSPPKVTRKDTNARKTH